MERWEGDAQRRRPASQETCLPQSSLDGPGMGRSIGNFPNDDVANPTPAQAGV